MKKVIYFLFFLIVSCSDNNIFKVDVSKIDIPPCKIERFEDIAFDIDEKNIEDIRKKYSVFFNENSVDKVWIDKTKDSLQLMLYHEVKKIFNDISWLEKDLNILFKHIKYYFPEFVVPKIYTYLDGSDYNIKNVYALDSKTKLPFIAIPLDLYLGENNIFYGIIEGYIKENMNKEMIVRDVAITLSKSLLPNKNHYPQLIESMVYNGKIMFMVNSFIPYITQENLFGYTTKKINWALANERDVWIYFMKKNLLYNSSREVFKRFIDISPFSKFYLEIDRESPGQIGIWIGYRIVKSYMKNNKDNLEVLLKKDELQIFKQSFYKP